MLDWNSKVQWKNPNPQEAEIWWYFHSLVCREITPSFTAFIQLSVGVTLENFSLTSAVREFICPQVNLPECFVQVSFSTKFRLLTKFDFKTLFLQNLFLHPYEVFLHGTHLFLLFYLSLLFCFFIPFSFYTNSFIQFFKTVGEIQITSPHQTYRARSRKHSISVDLVLEVITNLHLAGDSYQTW